MTLSAATPEFIKLLKNTLPDGTVSEVPDQYLKEPRDLYQGAAACLLRPKTTQDVSDIVKLCNQYNVGIIPYAGGTGLVGGQVADIEPAPVIVSVERMTEVRNLDSENNTLTIGAGTLLADIQTIADGVDRLFPLSLASEGSCRIGGNLATNAGGVQVLRYGNTRDLCLGVEVVLPNSSICDILNGNRKDNTGFDIRNMIVGSEGSLGIITAATLKLHPKPQELSTAFAVVSSPKQAVNLLGMLQSKLDGLVSAFELIHGQGLDFLAEALPDVRQPFNPHPSWMVLIEVAGGDGARLDERLAKALEAAVDNKMVSDVLVAQNLQQREEFWVVRESIPLANRAIGAIASTDISVPISAIPDFIKVGFARVAEVGSFRVNCFGHVGDGNLHYNVFPCQGQDRDDLLHLRDQVQMVIYDLVHEYGGSFSAEHGIGRQKVKHLEKYSDPAKLATMRAIKNALDPKGIMNPGVIVKPLL